MVEGQPDTHVEKKQDGKALEWLEIVGEERVARSAKTEEEKNACRGAHGPFVEDGHVDALHFFAKLVGSSRGHGPTIPQGVSGLVRYGWAVTAGDRAVIDLYA